MRLIGVDGRVGGTAGQAAIRVGAEPRGRGYAAESCVKPGARASLWRIHQPKQCPWIGGLLVAVVALTWAVVILTPTADRVFGWGGKGRFFDLRGSLAAAEFAHQGGNAYGPNPLDPSGRPHLYSSWWLAAGRFVDRRDTDAIGGMLAAVLLVTALACWWPRNAGEAAVETALLLSPAWLLAAYRGNNDIIVFAGVAVVIAWFARAGPRAHYAAAALTGVLAVLKYFPIAGVIGCLRARTRRERIVLIAIATVVLLIGYPSVLPALAVLGRYAPHTFGLHTFGATMLTTALPPSWPAVAGILTGLAAAAVGWSVAGVRGGSPGADGADDGGLAPAISGAVVVVCFAIGASFTYKAIFLWWFLRWLVRDAASPARRIRSAALLILSIGLCWADGITAAVLNLFATGWSVPARAHALAGVHLEMAMVQIGWWCLIGACARVPFDWSRRHLHEPSLRQ